MSNPFPIPGIPYGKRIIISVIEQRARNEPGATWISVPVDDADLSKGYKDITYKELNNAANHAAHWILHKLPASSNSKPFQPVAYAGPKDLRYVIFAVAAGKLQKKLILPNTFLTVESHLDILSKTKCEVYLATEEVEDHIKVVLQSAPQIQFFTAPKLEDLLQSQNTESIKIEFDRSWDEAKDDPWLVFHSSGSTGTPKPLTHTFRMAASLEIPAALKDIGETHIHQYANKRWYTHMRSMHYLAIVMLVIIPPFLNMTAVVSPPDLPAEVVPDVLSQGRVDGVLFTPWSAREIMSVPGGAQSLRNLEFIQYAGGVMTRHLGNQLSPYTNFAPLIGCTEAGFHFTEIRRDDKVDWDYYTIQPHAGVKFEHHASAMYEMVFIRQEECAVQPVFNVFPETNRFETGDMWTPHPTRPGLWKPIGRMSDFITLSNGKKYLVPQFERELEEHPDIQFAVIGGSGCPAPVLLLELSHKEDNNLNNQQQTVLESIKPMLTRIGEEIGLELTPELTVFAGKEKPFVLSTKFDAARIPTLKLYENEIKALFDGSMLQK